MNVSEIIQSDLGMVEGQGINFPRRVQHTKSPECRIWAHEGNGCEKGADGAKHGDGSDFNDGKICDGAYWRLEDAFECSEKGTRQWPSKVHDQQLKDGLSDDSQDENMHTTLKGMDGGDEVLLTCDAVEDDSKPSPGVSGRQSFEPSARNSKREPRQEPMDLSGTVKVYSNSEVSRRNRNQGRMNSNTQGSPARTPAQNFCFGASNVGFVERLHRKQDVQIDYGGHPQRTKSWDQRKRDQGDVENPMLYNPSEDSEIIPKIRKYPKAEERKQEIVGFCNRDSTAARKKLDHEAWNLIVREQGLEKKMATRGKKANFVKIGPEIPAPPPEEIPKPKRETKPKWEPKKESPAGRKKRLREEQLHDWDTESYKGAARPSKTRRKLTDEERELMEAGLLVDTDKTTTPRIRRTKEDKIVEERKQQSLWEKMRKQSKWGNALLGVSSKEL